MNMNKILVTIIVLLTFMNVSFFSNNVKLKEEILEQSELIVQQRILITEYQKNCKNAIEHLKLEELDTVQGICGNTPQ